MLPPVPTWDSTDVVSIATLRSARSVKSNKKIGDAGGDCTTVRIDEAASVAWCTEMFRLPEGEIVGQGLATFDPAVGGTEFTWAITGGTAAYSSARGEVDVAESNGGANSDLQFRFSR
jgi:hypothetical protein